MRVDIWSRHRRIRLDVAPLEDVQSQVLAVPEDTSDDQVLAWLTELDVPWLEQARAILESQP